MRYDAFISYSHAADGRLAPALQRALQQMAKPWYRRRSLEIFRDETGLSVDPHLWGAIVAALDDAEWFVLLTSPLAAQSEWVTEQTGDFTADSDAVPPEQQLDPRDSRFRNAVAEVAAPLNGKPRTKSRVRMSGSTGALWGATRIRPGVNTGRIPPRHRRRRQSGHPPSLTMAETERFDRRPPRKGPCCRACPTSRQSPSHSKAARAHQRHPARLLSMESLPVETLPRTEESGAQH